MPVPTRRTTVDIGTAFELHALAYLSTQLHMSLRRTGGAGDGGVDLRGWWWVPHVELQSVTGPSVREKSYMARRVRVLGQCKAEKKPLGPRAIRELEGVMSQLQLQRRSFSRADLNGNTNAQTSASDSSASSQSSTPDSSESASAIAILVSQSGFSKNAMQHATKSHTPLMLVHLPGGQPFGDLAPDRIPPLKAASAASILTPVPAQTHTNSKNDGAPGDLTPAEAIYAESVWWNRALGNGVLGGTLELRRLMTSGLGIEWGVYTNGKRLKLGPEDSLGGEA